MLFRILVFVASRLMFVVFVLVVRCFGACCVLLVASCLLACVEHVVCCLLCVA